MTSTWKGVESRLCARFITLPPEEKELALERLRTMRDSPRAKKEGSKGNDCKFWMTDPYSVSVKHGKQIPKTPGVWLKEAEFAAPEGSLPTLVLHPLGAREEDSLVVFRLKDFEEWFL